ncbi:MAG: F0F1 ATP synthase subunit delta [Lachnospirales bacterium]
MALIPTRYATALFDLALENNSVDKYYDDVKLVYNTISADKKLVEVLNHPQISGEEKLDILKKAFSQYVLVDVIGFFDVIFRKNRENELLDILSAFIKKAEDYKGICYAKVESAEALSEKTLENIKQKLSNNLNKQVSIEAKVDPKLLGGLKITVEGHIIDSTIKSQIERLKKQLLSSKLA